MALQPMYPSAFVLPARGVTKRFVTNARRFEQLELDQAPAPAG